MKFGDIHTRIIWSTCLKHHLIVPSIGYICAGREFHIPSSLLLKTSLTEADPGPGSTQIRGSSRLVSAAVRDDKATINSTYVWVCAHLTLRRSRPKGRAIRAVQNRGVASLKGRNMWTNAEPSSTGTQFSPLTVAWFNHPDPKKSGHTTNKENINIETNLLCSFVMLHVSWQMANLWPIYISISFLSNEWFRWRARCYDKNAFSVQQ